MHLLTVGLNHNTAPVSLRERISFAPDQIAHAVASARSWFGRHDSTGSGLEAAFLSTCNRTEMITARALFGSHGAEVDATAHFLADYHAVPYAELRPHLYAQPNEHAVRHCFRVASGLDSMVLGEAQILGQMKEAVRRADAGGGLGTYLHQLFQRTFSVAKEVRSTTAIGAHSISLAAAAVRMAQRIFPSIAEQHVLFVGAGDMIELCAAHFAAQRPKSITVANRTLSRAQALAERYHGAAIRLDQLPQELAKFDIVITCTGARTPIISGELVEQVVKARRRRPVFMVDLAVPRDVEGSVVRLPDIFLYTVDDLATLVQSAREQRQGAVKQAEAIIETRVQSYRDWAERRAMVPLIQSMHATTEGMRTTELLRAKKLLARGDNVEAVLEALSKGLTAKLLHGPQQALHHARGAERAHLSILLPQLFAGTC